MEPLTIHYIQHVPFEGLGCIEHWAKERGHRLTCTRTYEELAFPDLNAFDTLVVMGGPMSVNDANEWARLEKSFIKSAIDANKKVLGVCLGAQFIAAALGAKVFSNKEKEIGWFPVRRTTQDSTDLLGTFNEAVVFHWHGETFDLPANAVRLLSSEACANQAFVYQGNVLALQCHLEFNNDSFEDAMPQIKRELSDGKFIQTEKTINEGRIHIAATNDLMISILNRFVNNQT